MRLEQQLLEAKFPFEEGALRFVRNPSIEDLIKQCGRIYMYNEGREPNEIWGVTDIKTRKIVVLAPTLREALMRFWLEKNKKV